VQIARKIETILEKQHWALSIPVTTTALNKGMWNPERSLGELTAINQEGHYTKLDRKNRFWSSAEE
jgi:hypothetical protein